MLGRIYQGSDIGWTNPITLGMGAIAIVVGLMFFRPKPQLTSVRELRAVAQLNLQMMLVQLGGGLSAQEAGMLTLGYRRPTRSVWALNSENARIRRSGAGVSPN